MHEGGQVGQKMQGWYTQEQDRRVQDVGQEVGQAGQTQDKNSTALVVYNAEIAPFPAISHPLLCRKRYKRAYDALRTRGYEFNRLARPRYNNKIATSMYDGIFSALDWEIGGLDHGVKGMASSVRGR